MTEYDLIIVGDKFVGKTTFISRIINGIFIEEYIPTVECMMNSYNVPEENIIVNIFENIPLDVPLTFDCALIMFDKTNENSLDSVINYITLLSQQNDQIPICLVGTKTDSKNAFKMKLITNLLKFLKSDDNFKNLNIKYFDLSSKTNYNIDKPIGHLLKQLIN
jgi:GTPase SAR1 family protein